MRSNTVNYAVVGAFVVAMLIGLIVSIALLTGRTGATDPYHAVYDNVTGVKFGTQVLYEGYPIGQVETVTPVEQEGRMRFRVDLGVKAGWRIPENSIATIAAPGLLSAITISISAGDSRTPLKPASRIPAREQANVFAAMSSVAADVSALAQDSLKPLLSSVTKLLEGDAQVLVRDLSRLATDLSEQLPRIAQNVDEFAGKMNQSSDEIQELFKPENRKKLEESFDNANRASADFARLASELAASRIAVDDLLKTANETLAGSRPEVERTLGELRFVVESIARRIEAVNQNLEGASRNMYEFSRQIRQNPGLLLGGRPPEDAAGGR